MNVRELEYLDAVARFRHFGKAAEACFISQPTLSMQIKKLEDELGVTLVERTNKKVIVTEIGQLILNHARNVLGEIKKIEEIAYRLRDPFGGDLSLGMIPTVAPYLLPKILPRIRKRFPKLEVRIIESQTHVLLERIRYAQIDTAVMALPVEENNLEQCEIYSEPFYLSVNSEHRLAQKNEIRDSDLKGEKLLLLEDGHCLRDQALDVCHKSGAVEKTDMRATSIETLRQMVASNFGVTLVPGLALQKSIDRVRYIPFRAPSPCRKIGLVWRKSSPKLRLLKEVEALLQKTCSRFFE